ncbi:MAG: cysteine desulfurase family protein [Leptospirillia bacterium]
MRTGPATLSGKRTETLNNIKGHTMIHLHVDTMPFFRPGVREAMNKELEDTVVPTARTRRGLKKAERLEGYREEVARYAHSRPEEVIFVSSVTEANVWAIRGVRFPGNTSPDHVLVSPLEHSSVLRSAEALSRETGAKIQPLPLTPHGMVDTDALKKEWPGGRTLVSLQRVNPETGLIQPLEEVAEIVRERGGILHSDSLAAQGWEPLSLSHNGPDLMSLSSAISGGPAGIAALLIRRGIRINPWLLGGAQEDGRRAGSQPVFLAAGFAQALRQEKESLSTDRQRLEHLDHLFLSAIRKEHPDVKIASLQAPRRPGILNLLVPEVDGQALLSLLDREGVEVGTGASCSAQSLTVSHVLTALGYPARQAQGSILLSLGWWNRESDLSFFQSALNKSREILSRINVNGATA